MQRYGNRAGNSGVRAFVLVPGGIAVQFQGGEIYLYDSLRPGAQDVQQMAARALAGTGLSTYISRYVQHRFARKLTLEELDRLA